ncbi:hypothetical protein EMMF5_000977 [Cystobasidiomycetes sp. EMM_F5]
METAEVSNSSTTVTQASALEHDISERATASECIEFRVPTQHASTIVDLPEPPDGHLYDPVPYQRPFGKEASSLSQNVSTDNPVAPNESNRRFARRIAHFCDAIRLRVERGERLRKPTLDFADFLKSLEGPPIHLDGRYSLSKLASFLGRRHIAVADAAGMEALISAWEKKAELDSRWPRVPLSIYNVLVKIYALHINAGKAYATVDRLQRAQHTPSRFTYHALVNLHGNRRDAQAAQRVVDDMLKAGVDVNLQIYTSLMNAYTEDGQFEQAVSLFEYLETHPPGHPLQPDVATFTVLMKAYVLNSAPLSAVLGIYTTMVERHLTPTSRTFNILLQSACDAGDMDFAEETFAKMDANAEAIPDPHFNTPANVYAFTILIRGLLRHGNEPAAREYFTEMIRRGIEPSSATWSILVKAYSKDINDPATRAIAEELVEEFLRNYQAQAKDAADFGRTRLYRHDKTVASGTAVHSVFGPLIDAYARAVDSGNQTPRVSDSADGTVAADDLTRVLSGRNPANALTAFKRTMAQSSVKPSMPTYTALLDAYRRAGDLEGAREIWKVLYDFAISSTSLPESPATPSSRRSNIICLPLSVYIVALSDHGLHDEIAGVWAQAQEDGFGFDSGNWNHLAVALIKAGRLDRALYVVEQVLLQPQKRLLSTLASERRNPMVADAKTLFETEGPSHIDYELLDTRTETPMRPPNRASHLHVTEKTIFHHSSLPGLFDKIRFVGSSQQHDDSGYIVAEDAANGAVNDGIVVQRSTSADTQSRGMPAATADADAVSLITHNYNRVKDEARAKQWRPTKATLVALATAFEEQVQLANQDFATDDEAERLQISERVLRVSDAIERLRADYPLTTEAIARLRRRERIYRKSAATRM